MDSLMQELNERSDLARSIGEPTEEPEDYIFPWFILLTFVLSWLVYSNEKSVPGFLYRELWLTVTVLCLLLYWGPVWTYWLLGTPSPTDSLVPEVVRRTLKLSMAAALGYGVFLLARRFLHAKS